MLTEVGLEEWPFIAATIGPAVTKPSLEEVREGLRCHHMQAWRPEKNRGVAGYLITTTAYVGDTRTTALWITYVAGKVFHPVRRRMGELIDALEAQARAWGCNETRIEESRLSQWRLVLPGYEMIDGRVLRKVLNGN